MRQRKFPIAGRSRVAHGWQRLHARNPAASAASGSEKNRTLFGLAGREAHDGLSGHSLLVPYLRLILRSPVSDPTAGYYGRRAVAALRFLLIHF
jgi:hypothetical protein